MSSRSGQIATEFVLVLPCVCAALLIFILCALYIVRANKAVYAGFMAARVYSVWPEENREEMAGLELNKLLKGAESAVEAEGGNMKAISVMDAPFKFFQAFDDWSFETNAPYALEPESSCAEEDNALPKKEPEVCL